MAERIVDIYVLKDPETSIIYYVGRSVNIKTRYRQHIFLARRSKKKNRKDAWILSILNKGLKPLIEIIESVPEEICVEREIFWIDTLGKTIKLKNDRDIKYENSYYIFSDKSRKKMSESQKGNRNKKGKKLTKEQSYNCGNARRGKKQSYGEKLKRFKRVIQYDMNGDFIREWESVSSAANNIGTTQGTISLAASGKRKSSHGFIWKYK